MKNAELIDEKLASRRSTTTAVGGTLVFLLGILTTFALLQGSFGLSFVETLQTLFNWEAPDSQLGFIIVELRLPRALTAMLVGAAFALSGALMQAVLRNPLADPGILGINSGAALAAMLIVVTYRDVPPAALPIAATAGAIGTTIFIYAFAWRGGVQPMRLVLIGIGVAAFLGAITSSIATFGRIEDVQRAMIWLSGTVYGKTMSDVGLLAIWCAVLIPAALVTFRRLDLMLLGDENATGLGLPLERTRAALIALATVLAAVAVSAAGTIGFVGLVAPHLARRLVGSSHDRLLPISALLGAVIVLSADIAGQHVIAPAQLPAGIMTAILGGPYFIYLLWTRTRTRQ